MAGRISVYGFGKSGVVIDLSPLDAGVPDDSLRLAQNATHDPTAEFGGAIRKRPGLKQFNLENAGGPILGGIPMAVAGTGGAPASGGGSTTGSSVGAGDSTGAPGATFDGGSPVASVGAASFGSTGSGPAGLFSGARLLVVGRMDTTSAFYGQGWWVTSKKMANTALLITSPGPPYISVYSALWGNVGGMVNHPYAITDDGFLYYVERQTVLDSYTGLTIRRTNGATDAPVAVIPITLSGDSHARMGIPFMLVGDDGLIYLGVHDEITGSPSGATAQGRVYRFDPAGGPLTVLGIPTSFVFSDVPYCGAVLNGRLYWGGYTDTEDTASTIYVASPDFTYANADRTGIDSAFASVTCMATYGGRLWAGFQVSSASPVFSKVASRSPSAAVAAADAWTDHTAASTGSSAANRNLHHSMVVFNDALYVSFYNPSDKGQIYKYVKDNLTDPEDTAVTITKAYDSASTKVPFNLFVDDGVLYAVGSTWDGSTGSMYFLWTTDGTTWTDATSNFPTTNTSHPVPVFFGLNQ